MKRLFVVILMSCLAYCYIVGQIHKTIELSFQPTDFICTETEGAISINSYKYVVQFGSDTSEPALPIIPIHILIGRNEEFSGFNYSYNKEPFSIGKRLVSNPYYVPRNMISQLKSYIPSPNYIKDCYPSECVRYTGTHCVDGYKYITFCVSPFVYLTQDNEILLNNKIKLDIQLTRGPVGSNIGGRTMRNVVENIIYNKEDMASLYAEQKRSILRSGLSQNSEWDYLIITCDSFRNAFQKLARWKTRKGIPTTILTKEAIDTTYMVYNNHEQPMTTLSIKRAIKDFKDRYGIKYVLLGGDDSIIQSEMCHLQYNNQTPWDNAHAASDLYYACLNNPMDWDYYNPNYISAEYEDLIDMHPQIAVSRLSVNSIADALMQVDKIINYERDPEINECNSKLLAAGSAFNRDFLLYGLTDVCYKGRLIRDSLQNLGISESFLFYDRLTSHPDGANYDVSVDHFKEQLQNGYSFIQFDGHGDTDCFELESYEYFRNQDALDFINPVYSIIMTSACSTNEYNNGDCLGESFMRNPSGKVVAYWGGTQVTLGDPNETSLRSLDYINLSVYTHLFQDEESHLGDAINEARLEFITTGNMPYSSPYRWNLLCMNLLGDPEMPIYTGAPKKLYYKDIYFDENEGCLFVDFLEEIPTKVCIMSLHDNGNSFYLVDDFIGEHYSNYGYKLDFLQPDKDYTLCFTRSGYKPYILNVYNSGIVQNDSIANDAVVWSNNVYVGSDVTTQRTYGPVIVENGDMVIKARGGAIIKNDFTLKKGATLTIDPNFIDLNDIPEE